MRLKIFFVVVFVFGFNFLKADVVDSLTFKTNKTESLLIETDNQIDSLINDLQPQLPFVVEKQKNIIKDTVRNFDFHKSFFWDKLNAFKPVEIDSLTLESNPFFTDLVYFDKPLHLKWNAQDELLKLLRNNVENNIIYRYSQPFKTLDPNQIVSELRSEIRRRISVTAPELFAFRSDRLPDTNALQSHAIAVKPLSKVQFTENENIDYTRRKLEVQKSKLSPWTKKANSLIQFSENYVSDNWYQGGSSNIAILGILTGQLNYDNKKNIQWENNAEWRAGFNTVEGDTLRLLSTNDDIFKIYSKLGIKAGGNWFYSGSVDFSSQLFKNYKAVNSKVMKANFMTPVRVNVSIGLDYKYKKLFSLMVSPVSFKYIYASDIVNVSPKLFGIAEGEHVLTQIGSSFKAQFSYAPVREIQFDSKLSFYTNYQKVEVDWELVGNFTINRYLSTRLSLNPRYDNTVILAAGEKAKIQFKELLSFGFSYKLLN